MTRKDIFDKVEEERAYQNKKWGSEFDSKNTPNDWVTYMTKYLGQSVTMPFDEQTFRKQLLKVITIGVAALEQDKFAPRHYDNKQ